MTVLAAPLHHQRAHHRQPTRFGGPLLPGPRHPDQLPTPAIRPVPALPDSGGSTPSAAVPPPPVVESLAVDPAGTDQSPATDIVDFAWLDRVRQGDRSVWVELTRHYRALVAASARSVVSDAADVDEAVQRTWIALWQHGGSVREPARLAGWLRVTARREGLGILRRRREALVGDLALLDRPGERSESDRPRIVCDPPCDPPMVAVERDERHSALNRAIDRLPAAQRRLIRTLLQDGLTYDEISVRLGIPRGSIGPMRLRALATLRRLMAEWA